MEIELSGRRALVPRSSQGIGLAIATELARAGAAVVVDGAREGEDGTPPRTGCTEVPGADVTAVTANLASADGAEALRERVGELATLVSDLGIFAATAATSTRSFPDAGHHSV